MQNIPFHPIADIFPLILGSEFAELKDDIRTNGVREPIWMYEGKILDGRNRFRACQEVGAKPSFKEYLGDSPASFVISLNMHRRHLTASQKAAVGVEFLPYLEAEAKVRQMGTLKQNADTVPAKLPERDKGDARDKAAELVSVSPRYVSDAKRIKNESPENFEKIKSGEKTIAEVNREELRAKKQDKIVELKARESAPAGGKYDVVVIDPPWPMEKIEREVRPNQVAFDYPVMSEREIQDVQMPMADNCHVWVWTTHKFLPMALRCVEAWGLKYVCTFVWHKPGGFQPIGLPQYNCEFALYCRKGSPLFADTKAFNTAFTAPRGQHSEKPEEFYDVVRRVTAGKRIDMFNRREIDGFDTWGNESAAMAG